MTPLDPRLYVDLIGVKYEADGRDPATGLDCLGLVLLVQRRRGFVMDDPTVARLAADWARSWIAVDRPEPGDAVLWDLAGGQHIGVMVNPRRVLHASHNAGVVVSPLGAEHRAAGFYRARPEPLPATVLQNDPQFVTIRVVNDALAAGGKSTVLAAADGTPVGALLPPGWELAPELVSIVLEGRRIPQAAWADVVPKGGEEMVVTRMPRFGAAFFTALGAVEGGSLVAAGGALTALGAIAATALNVIVGIGLSYATSALLAPAGLARRESEEGSPTYNLSGIRNSIRPGGPIPVLYGTMTSGGQIAQAYYDVDEEGRSILYVLTVLSQGEISNLGGLGVANRVGGSAIPETFKINGNPARNYQGVRVSTRLGRTDQDTIPGFRDLITVAPYNVTLDDDVSFTHTTSGPVDAFQLNFHWPRGLGEFDANSGNLGPITVTYTVEFRRRGTTAWTTSGPLTITKGTTAAFSSKFKQVGLVRDRYEVRVTVTSPDWPPENSQQFWEMQLRTVNEIRSNDLNYADLACVGWEALATGQLNGGLPTFVVETIKGKLVYVWDGVSETAPVFTKQWSESPAWCAFDVITRKRYGLGAFFDAGSTLLSSFAEAEVFHAELVADGRGGTHRRGVCNFAADTTRKGWDLVQLMLAPFRTAPIMFGKRIRLRLEKSVVSGGVVAYSQMFTMGNIVRGSFRLSFRNPALAPNVVEVQFPNEENNFEGDVIPRQDNAALQAGAPIIKATISFPVLTHPGRAARAAQFRLNLELANPHTLEFSALLDAVALEPGDVFGFQHDVVNEVIGGRFSFDAGLGLFAIDADLTVPGGERWALVYRTAVAGVDTFYLVYVNPGTYPAGSDIPPVDITGAPIFFTVSPLRHDIYSCGPPSKVLTYYRCVDLTLNPDFTRRVMGVEYIDAVYDDNPGAVPTATDRLPSRKLHPDPVTGLRVVERSLKQADGTVTQSAEVGFESARGEPCDVYVRQAS